MKEQTKYTTDGRKVLVVGKLNAAQHIVQEIFVSNGQEIPSGENFVVSRLHDVPVESWKEKNLRELKARYEKTRDYAERRIKKVEERTGVAEAKAREKASALLAFAKNSDDVQLQRLHAFLAGEITHVFVDNYRPEIVDWNDNALYDTDSWGGRLKVDGLKLVSLYGRSDGQLDYRLSKYRDGSGINTHIVPCRSYEEALAEAQRVMEAESAKYVAGEQRSFALDKWRRISGIQIPEDAMKKFEESARQSWLAKIERLRDELAKLEADGVPE